MASMFLRVGIAVSVCVSTVAGAYDFLGAESCQSCHPDAYAAWKASPHSRAKDVLSPSQQRDARCLSCHSPSDVDQKQAGVTCETCHGGGQYYSPKYVMKDPELARLSGLIDPTEKACRACHDASSPSLNPFDFASRLKAMDHWSVERAKKKGPSASVVPSQPKTTTFAAWLAREPAPLVVRAP
ncbi:MAG: cytochrome c3 family protein [Myxococcales bacterium]|nr:cytochrome c3 family protein [Myxococcales bacterium]